MHGNDTARFDVLFTDENHRIEHHRTSREKPLGLIYTFTPKTFANLNYQGFGVRYLTNCGYDVIAFKCTKDNWYQELELATIQEIGSISKSYSFTAAYGSSMGGFAAMLFSRILAVDLVLAISPQFTIEQEFDARWTAQSHQINWRYRITDEFSGAPRLVLIYDDLLASDRAHIDEIRKLTCFQDVRSYAFTFSGHPTAKFLNQTETLSSIIASILRGETEINVGFPWSVLKKSQNYFLFLAEHAEMTGRMNLARLCYERATGVPPHDGKSLFLYSQFLSRSGNKIAAMRNAQRAVELVPDNSSYRDYLGALLRQQNA